MKFPVIINYIKGTIGFGIYIDGTKPEIGKECQKFLFGYKHGRALKLTPSSLYSLPCTRLFTGFCYELLYQKSSEKRPLGYISRSQQAAGKNPYGGQVIGAVGFSDRKHICRLPMVGKGSSNSMLQEGLGFVGDIARL